MMTYYVHPLPGQVLLDVDCFRSKEHQDYGDGNREQVADLDQANAITSQVIGKVGVHKPVLDIDLPVKIIASTTSGHFHLYIDKEMSWPQYTELLKVLTDIGIIEEGYTEAAYRRGYTTVRLPWIKKEEPSDTCLPVV